MPLLPEASGSRIAKPFNLNGTLWMHPMYPWLVPDTSHKQCSDSDELAVQGGNGDRPLPLKKSIAGGVRTVFSHAFTTLVAVVRRGQIGAAFDRLAPLMPSAAFHEYQMIKVLYLTAKTAVKAFWPRTWHFYLCRVFSSGVAAGIAAPVAGKHVALLAAIALFVGCRDELLLFPKRDYGSTTEKNPPIVTVLALRNAAVQSAARHRNHIKKDTGYYCYVPLRCQYIGVVRGGGNGAPQQNPSNIDPLKDVAIFRWLSSSMNTEDVRVRCDIAVDPSRLVRLPGGWKEVLKNASLALAKPRFNAAQLRSMGSVSAAEHIDKLLLQTGHRAQASLECLCPCCIKNKWHLRVDPK